MLALEDFKTYLLLEGRAKRRNGYHAGQVYAIKMPAQLSLVNCNQSFHEMLALVADTAHATLSQKR
jgi:hypothetical protein